MSRLRKNAENINDEWFAYHGTDRKYLDNILKNGLVPGNNTDLFNKSYVFLASNKDLASSYSGKDPVILKIKLTQKNLNEIMSNNILYPYDNNFKLSQLDEILIRDGLDSNVVKNDSDDDFDIMIINIEEEYSSELAKRIEDEIFENYFDSAELIVSKIEPNQIVEIL